MLNIFVCIKVVTDPEAPASTFKIDPEGRKALPAQGVPPVLNPYDENSLEAALKIKDKQPCKITVLSAGKVIPKAIIKKSLAVGADELILIEDEIFEDTDSFMTAGLLAAAIKKAGAFDMILTGRMASDTNAGQAGSFIAEIMGIPCVSMAQKIEVNEGKARIERATADGHETVEAGLPCLVTVSHEIGELRQATVKGLMAALKQPFTTWKVSDLGLSSPAVRRNKARKLFIPDRKVNCEIIPGETPEEAGSNLAKKIQQIRQI